MKTLILNKKDIFKIINMSDAIDSVEQAYRIFTKDMLEQPPIMSIDIPKHNGELDIKTCYSKIDDTISIKSASGYWNNQKIFNLPTLFATIMLLDGKTGYLLCIMDGSLITGYRTGAAGGLSASLLARKNSKKVAVIGAGNQARMQVKAIKEVLDVELVYVWSPSKDELISYRDDIVKDLGLKVEICETAKDAVIKADIIVTATPGRKAIVKDEWIKEGTHIIAVGADMDGKQELDTKIFRRAKIYVDSIQQCLERGETLNAIKSGDINKDDIYAELGEVILERKTGRTSDEEITIFDTTGMGIQDNTLATLLYNKALKLDIGSMIDLL